MKALFKEGKVAIGLGMIALSLLFVYEGRNLEFGSLTSIGPGFFPRIVALFGIGMGLLAIAETLVEQRKRSSSDKPAESEEATRMTRDERMRLLLVFVGLLSYCILLVFIGFLASTFAVTAFLMLLMRKQKYVSVAIASACTTLGLWLVFEQLLQMRLPQGVLWS